MEFGISFKSLKTGLFFIFILLFGYSAQAAQFTASLTVSSPKSEVVYDLKVKDNMYRIEKTKGLSFIPSMPTIHNRSTGISWGLNSQAKQYIEQTDPAKTMMMDPVVGWKFMRKNLEDTQTGMETIEGYSCQVHEYRQQGNTRIENRVWVSTELGFILKEVQYALNGNVTLALKNIKEDSVDPALFEIPPGYSKVVMENAPKKDKLKTALASKKNTSSNNLIFILDASGSMWGQVGGTAKITIAKEVLTGLIQELPDDTVVGLVAYGHRRKGDCNDVEQLIALKALNKEAMIAQVQKLNPKGKTPISRSVRLTAEKIKHLEDETTIILISDGKETCDPDPCALVKDLKASGIKFVMHVIGFDVTKEERKQLECMAKAGGGTYYTADNAGEFLAAAKELVKVSTFTGGYLKITSLKNSKPFDARVSVYNQSDNEYMGNKNTWYRKKPAEFKLIPGIYRILISDASVTPKQTQEIRDINIASGETVEKTVTFGSAGMLRIRSLKEDHLVDEPAEVVQTKNKKPLATPVDKRAVNTILIPETLDEVKVLKSRAMASDKSPFMNGEVPLYSGAKIIKSKSYDNNVMAKLEVTATPAEVVEFYKERMLLKGWKSEMVLLQGNKGVLIFKKLGRQLVIKVKGKDMISKIDMTIISQ